LSETHYEPAVVENLVENAAEEVRDTVILEYVVYWSFDTPPDAERARVTVIDAPTIAVPVVLVTWAQTDRIDQHDKTVD